MEPEANNGTKIYNAVYRHGVDDKRRVQVPAKWRPEQPGTEFTVVIWKKDPEATCLRVLPPSKMAELLKDISALPKGDQRKSALARLVGGGSVQVTLDSVGRICLPEQMTTAAGITDTAVMVGVLDKFEIWSPDRYEKVQQADNVMASEAFRLMD